MGIALAREDGLDDGLGTDSVYVAEDLVEFEVHFRQGLLHAMKMAGGFPDETVAVAGEVSQGQDFLGGAEGFLKQSGSVELLEPLGVADVCLLARHSFDMAGVDQEDFDARTFECVRC